MFPEPGNHILWDCTFFYYFDLRFLPSPYRLFDRLSKLLSRLNDFVETSKSSNSYSMSIADISFLFKINVILFRKNIVLWNHTNLHTPKIENEKNFHLWLSSSIFCQKYSIIPLFYVRLPISCYCFEQFIMHFLIKRSFSMLCSMYLICWLSTRLHKRTELLSRLWTTLIKSYF